jgi:hypothetical protein
MFFKFSHQNLRIINKSTTLKKWAKVQQKETFKLIKFSIKRLHWLSPEKTKKWLFWFPPAKTKIWQLTKGHPDHTKKLCCHIWEYFYLKSHSPKIPLVLPKHIREIALQSSLFD